MPSLLAVDVGIRTGLAAFRDDGRLIWYRSQNFGAASRLKRAIPALLHEAFTLLRHAVAPTDSPDLVEEVV